MAKINTLYNENEKLNLFFRRADIKHVLFSGVLLIILLIPLHLFYYFKDARLYTNLIERNIVFNFFNTSIIFVTTTLGIFYYLITEAKMQNKQRKYYYVQKEQSYENIFKIEIATAFSILLSIFFFFSYLISSLQIDDFFKFNQTRVQAYIIFYLIVPCVVFAAYYLEGSRRLLYFFIVIYDRIFINKTRSSLNNEIYFSKLNNTDLWLTIFRIANINEISEIFKKTPEYMTKKIAKELRKKVRRTDITIVLNPEKAVIGYLIDNLTEENVEAFIHNKIKSYLQSRVSVKKTRLDLLINYQITNIKNNDKIDTEKDIINIGKSI